MKYFLCFVLILLWLPASVSLAQQQQLQQPFSVASFGQSLRQIAPDLPVYVPKGPYRGPLLYKQARYDAVIQEALVRLGFDSPSNHFFVALAHKLKLGLTDIQAEKLLGQGFLLPRLAQTARDRNDTTFVASVYEEERLMQILTEYQYDLLLQYICEACALESSLEIWNEAKKYHLVNETTSVDSFAMLPQLRINQLRFCVTNERYKNNPEQREKVLQVQSSFRISILVKLKFAKDQEARMASQAIKTSEQANGGSAGTPPAVSEALPVVRGMFIY